MSQILEITVYQFLRTISHGTPMGYSDLVMCSYGITRFKHDILSIYSQKIEEYFG